MDCLRPAAVGSFPSSNTQLHAFKPRSHPDLPPHPSPLARQPAALAGRTTRLATHAVSDAAQGTIAHQLDGRGPIGTRVKVMPHRVLLHFSIPAVPPSHFIAPTSPPCAACPLPGEVFTPDVGCGPPPAVGKSQNERAAGWLLLHGSCTTLPAASPSAHPHSPRRRPLPGAALQRQGLGPLHPRGVELHVRLQDGLRRQELHRVRRRLPAQRSPGLPARLGSAFWGPLSLWAIRN
jgi:hypothetical protein